jgi:uncharacterized protein
MLVSISSRLPKAAGGLFLFLKIALLTMAGWLMVGNAYAQHTPLPTIDLYAGMHRVQAELAVKADERAQGLMGRPSLPEQRGMLFIFDRPGVQCFWMRNTLIPLSIAFLRDDGSIVNIEDMQPLKDDSHCSSEPVRLALEVNQGWFDKRNIKPGMVIRGLPSLK